VRILTTMKTKDLRVLFVVDAMKGRNGVGAYFQDLVAHLDGVVARAEVVSPSLEDPHPCQGLSMPIPGDPTQRLFLPKMRELTALVWEMKPHVIVIPGPGIFSLGAFWVARKLGIPVCVTFQTDYDSLVRLYWGPRLARLAGGLLNWVNRTLFQGSSAVATICESLIADARAAGARHPQLVGTPLGPEFVERPPLPLAEKLDSVLYVGRLAAEKNIERFLALAAQRPDCRFTVGLVITTPACGINQWPELARGLAIMEEGESLGDTLARLQAQSPAQRRERAEQARHAALTMNQRAMDTWLQVLGHCARQAPLLPKRWPSPTLAVLRRLSTARPEL